MAHRPREKQPYDDQNNAAPSAANHPTKAGPPAWVAMSGLGFEFVAAVLLPGGLGWWIDRKAGTSPWIMLVGGLIGFAIGLRLLMKTVNRPPSK